MASCVDSPPADASPPEAATEGASAPRASSVVEIAPVVISGDAGAQALLRRYDATQACGNEKQSAALSCPAIGLGVLNALKDSITGIATSLHASLVCGKDLRALSDCSDEAETLQSNAAQVIADCHERGGTVSPGASNREIICEVTP